MKPVEELLFNKQNQYNLENIVEMSFHSEKLYTYGGTTNLSLMKFTPMMECINHTTISLHETVKESRMI